MRILGVIPGILASISAAAGPAEDRFWDWFRKNEADLYSFEDHQDRTFAALSRELARVNSDLTFEFGPIEDVRRDFVISAGGIRAAFPAVEALVAAAPTLPRWRWVKFRPKRAVIHDVTYGGRPVPASDVRYVMFKDGAKIGLIVLMKGFTKSEETFFGQVAYLMLDEAIGEYDMETKVGAIEFRPADDPMAARSYPITELGAHFSEVVSR